jgi:hypothetical protein
MKWLSFERRALHALFDTMLPSGAHPRVPLGARDVPMERFVDDLLAQTAPRFLLGLRASLWVIVLSPLLVLGRPRTFLGLSPANRLLLLDRLRAHPRYFVRETINVVKAVACLGYCALPSVRAQVGMEGAEMPSWAADGERAVPR